MKRTIILLLCLLLCLPSALAEESVYARTLVEDVFVNSTLLTEESYPEVCLMPSYPFLYFSHTSREPLFLCFSYPDSCQPKEYNSYSARVMNSQDGIVYNYQLLESYSFEEFLNRTDSEEDIIRDGTDGTAAYMKLSETTNDCYAYGLIKTTEFGKSAKLVIDVRMYRVSKSVSMEERREMMREIITKEIDRVRSEMKVRTISPYWNSGKYAGIKMLDYDFRMLTVLDFFPIAAHKKVYGDDYGNVYGDYSLTEIDGTRVKGVYNLQDGAYLEFEMGLNEYKSDYSNSAKNQSDTGTVRLDNGNEWNYYFPNRKDSGEPFTLRVQKKADGWTNDRGEDYYIHFYFAGSNCCWDSDEEAKKIIGEIDSHLRFVSPQDDPYTAPVHEDFLTEPVKADEDSHTEWTCPDCGTENSGKFCSECGRAKPAEEWTCPNCGTLNKGKYCTECGSPRP